MDFVVALFFNEHLAQYVFDSECLCSLIGNRCFSADLMLEIFLLHFLCSLEHFLFVFDFFHLLYY